MDLGFCCAIRKRGARRERTTAGRAEMARRAIRQFGDDGGRFQRFLETPEGRLRATRLDALRVRKTARPIAVSSETRSRLNRPPVRRSNQAVSLDQKQRQ
jgi:hypothetical protein